MPAQWTGEVVGKIHNNRLTAMELADALGRIIERKSKSIPETKEGEGIID